MRDLRGISRQYQKYMRPSSYKLMYVPKFPFSLDRGIIGCAGERVHTSVREAIAKARMEEQEEKYPSRPTSVARFLLFADGIFLFLI